MKRAFISNLIILSLLVLMAGAVNAAVNPVFKECVQRGYETAKVNSTYYCLFPDGSNCTIESFNNGSCGSEFRTDDYCVEEGTMVWDEEMCCPGTEAYMPPGRLGQPACVKVSATEKLVDQLEYRPYLLGVLVGIIIAVILWLSKKGFFRDL